MRSQSRLLEQAPPGAWLFSKPAPRALGPSSLDTRAHVGVAHTELLTCGMQILSYPAAPRLGAEA